ncbi:MAG: hypothetical protein MMC23_001236 [Stictis urceolatum]|nr:hypothetical protein [Stictis urceolata]
MAPLTSPAAIVGDAIINGTAIVAKSINGIGHNLTLLVAQLTGIAKVETSLVVLTALAAANIVVVTILGILYAKRSGYINGYHLGELAGHNAATRIYEDELTRLKNTNLMLTDYVHSLIKQGHEAMQHDQETMQHCQEIVGRSNEIMLYSNEAMFHSNTVLQTNSGLMERLDDVIRQNTDLTISVKDAETNIHNLTMSENMHKALIKRFTDNCETLEKENTSAVGKIGALAIELEALRQEKADLEGVTVTAQEKSFSLARELSNAYKTTCALQKEIGSLKERNIAPGNDYQLLKGDLEDLGEISDRIYRSDFDDESSVGEQLDLEEAAVLLGNGI